MCTFETVIPFYKWLHFQEFVFMNILQQFKETVKCSVLSWDHREFIWLPYQYTRRRREVFEHSLHRPTRGASPTTCWHSAGSSQNYWVHLCAIWRNWTFECYLNKAILLRFFCRLIQTSIGVDFRWKIKNVKSRMKRG